MKKISFVALGILCSLVVAEAIFRLLPTISGMQNPTPTKADSLLHYYPRADYCYSRGWNMRNNICAKMNNFGYASVTDYSTAVSTVAVIGDSYIEALMIPGGERMHEQMHKRLRGGRQAISLGLSGSDLGDYLVAADYATRTFQIWALVFLLNDGDIVGAASRRLRGYWFTKRADGIEIDGAANVYLRNAIYGSAFLSYVYANLKFDPKSAMRGKVSEGASGNDALPNGARTLPNREYVVKFLETVQSMCHERRIDPDRVVFLFDADRKAIYEGKEGRTLAPELLKLVAKYGFKFVDLDPVLRTDWERRKKIFDFGVVDAHWNSYTHQLVAEHVLRLIGAKTQ